MKLTFKRLFDNSLSKYLILKHFLAYNSCFGLFAKIIKGSWTGFRCIVSAGKNLPCLMLCQLTKFQCHILFPSRDIKLKQNVLLSSYLDNC